MNYLLFIFYLLLFTWLVTRVRFFRQSGISQPMLVILFLLKVIAGIFYGWMGIYYSSTAQMVDTWHYHEQASIEYGLLWNDTHEYLTNLFRSNYENGYAGFFSVENSYWNDLRSNAIIKFISILHIFSFENYYINVIFYSFLTFFGPIAIYRTIVPYFPTKKIVLLLGTFLVPSFLYWSSGLHKEGLIFLAISIIVFQTHRSLEERKINARQLLLILFGFTLLFLLRNALIIVLIPGLLAWVISKTKQWNPLACFAGCYVLFILLFFNIRYIFPSLDLPQAVATKHAAFLTLKGKTSISLEALEPTIGSFLLHTPEAISISVLRPFPSDIRHLPSLFASAETLLLLIIFALALFLRKPNIKLSDPLFLFLVFFSISWLLVIGFSVNNLGAVVRYRSIILPFLAAPALAVIDWNLISGFFSSAKKREIPQHD